MSINAIQFQRGLSLPQFQALYGSEQQCERALVAARWPHGWQCAHCGCKRFSTPAMARADCCGVFHLWLPKLIYRGHRDGTHPHCPLGCGS